MIVDDQFRLRLVDEIMNLSRQNPFNEVVVKASAEMLINLSDCLPRYVVKEQIKLAEFEDGKKVMITSRERRSVAYRRPTIDLSGLHDTRIQYIATEDTIDSSISQYFTPWPITCFGSWRIN